MRVFLYCSAAVLASLAIAASPVAAQIVNGSFEASPPGGPPPAPWNVVGGGTVSVSAAANDLFPSHGAQYLTMSPTGVGPAAPAPCPVQPGPWTGGVVQVWQSFVRPPGVNAAIQFDWEMIQAESLPEATFNDFFDVEIRQGVGPGGNMVPTPAPVANNGYALYIDTGPVFPPAAPCPAYVNVPGGLVTPGVTYVPDQSTVGGSGNQAPAGFKTAWFDLTSIAGGTTLTIVFTIGNRGDSVAAPTAYVDNVILTAGQRNATSGEMRVLGSSHTDGISTSGDTGGDLRPETPFSFRCCPGQRMAIRTSGATGAGWVLVAGTIARIGTVVAGLGQVNLSLTNPLSIIIDGVSGPPNSPASLFLGTISSTGTNFYEGSVPSNAPLGLSGAIQAIVANAAAPLGFTLTAATEIVVGAPQIPIGGTLTGGAAGGAQQDDSFTTVALAPLIVPFYGVAVPSVDVNSNGYLMMALAPVGNSDFTESEVEMRGNSARVAVVWDDLILAGGGGAGQCRHTLTGSTFTVSWTGVPEFGTNPTGNNFAAQMYGNGVISLYYGSTTMPDGLVGISPGGLAAPAALTDFSLDFTNTTNALGARAAIAAGTARFEEYQSADFHSATQSIQIQKDTFDLMTAGSPGPGRVTFVPQAVVSPALPGANGYQMFVGTR